MPWPWDDEEDNEDFSRSGGGSDTWATQEELRDEYRRSMQEPEETPVEPWEEAYGGSERDLPGFTESSNAIPDPRRQPGPPETMGGRPGAVDPPGYFQGRQSPEAAAPRAPQIFNQRGGQWVEQTDQPSAADLRALTEDPFGATARRLRDRWREQEGVSARERQRLEWDGATQEERARQEVREMTAEMPITQRDRIQMQRLSNEIARISDLADSNTITSTVAAAAIARRGAQLTDLRQRETDERTRTESEERQRASRLQQAAILQQAGWTAEAAVIFDEVANRGRPRTPSGDIAHRDEQGAVIGHSVPAENGQRQFVPAQQNETEGSPRVRLQQQHQQAQRAAAEQVRRQTLANDIDDQMEKEIRDSQTMGPDGKTPKVKPEPWMANPTLRLAEARSRIDRRMSLANPGGPEQEMQQHQRRQSEIHEQLRQPELTGAQQHLLVQELSAIGARLQVLRPAGQASQGQAAPSPGATQAPAAPTQPAQVMGTLRSAAANIPEGPRGDVLRLIDEADALLRSANGNHRSLSPDDFVRYQRLDAEIQRALRRGYGQVQGY